MTNIPQAAIDAAAERFDAGPGFDVSILARYALEAAMPHIRKQVAAEIRAEAAKRAGTAGWDTAFHNLGLVTAARIAEGDPK